MFEELKNLIRRQLIETEQMRREIEKAKEGVDKMARIALGKAKRAHIMKFLKNGVAVRCPHCDFIHLIDETPETWCMVPDWLSHSIVECNKCRRLFRVPNPHEIKMGLYDQV